MAHTSDMLNLRELSERLSEVSAPKLAEASKVSLKTIYRLRQNPDYGCTLKTAEKLMSGLSKVGRKSKKARA